MEGKRRERGGKGRGGREERKGEGGKKEVVKPKARTHTHFFTTRKFLLLSRVHTSAH